MKKLAVTLFMVIGLASTLSAHHPSPSDNAGGNMSSNSGHLDLDFLSGM